MHSVVSELACGAFGGTTAALLTYPLDTTKARVQAGVFPTVSACVRETLRREGVRGFYRGCSTPVVSQPLYIGSAFGGMEAGRAFYDAHLKPTDPGSRRVEWLERLVFAGTCAGVSCATVVTGVQRQHRCESQHECKSDET